MKDSSFALGLRLPGRILIVTLVLALAAVGSAGAAHAQEASLVGTVLDGESRRPVDGAQVFVPGTSLGTLSSGSGRFLIAGVPAGTVTVRVEHLGYVPLEQIVQVRSGESLTLQLSLTQTAVQLDEIVVTGAGQATERRRLGHVVATLHAESVADAPVLRFSELAQGRIPGVSFQATGGMAGEASQIRIRGTSSLTQDNNPVVYVDGIRITTEVDDNDPGAGSRLDDINPASIERIEILKGAAAATLYGTEASNGVIQIFTKGGAIGAPRWDASIEAGVSRMDMGRYEPHAGFICSAASATFLDPADSCTPQHAQRMADLWGIEVPGPYEVFEVPLLDPLFETGVHQAYNLSVQGGTDRVSYYVGGRFAHEDGAFGGNQFGPAQDLDVQRQGSASVSFLASERLRLRVNTSYVEREHETPTNGNNRLGALSVAIMSKPELAAEDNPTGSVVSGTIRELLQVERREDAQRFLGSVHAELRPAAGLTLSATAGVDVSNAQEVDFQRYGWNVDGFATSDPQGTRALNDHNRRETTLDARAAWDTRLGPTVSSSLVVGTQILRSLYHRNESEGWEFPAPGLEVTGAAAIQSAFEQRTEEVSAGVFFQEQVGYRDYLFATLGGRYDEHSAFGDRAGGAFYPKASLSWIPTDMPGLASVGPVSSLRLRASIGQSGLQPGAFDALTTFRPAPSVDGPGVSPGNLGNPDLVPEVSTEWEVGGDFGLLEDRVFVELTYWDRTVDDVLVARQFPPSGGFATPQLNNIGEMTAHGFEAGITGSVINSERVSLSLFATAAYLREKITSMGGAAPIKVGDERYRTWIVEGFAPGSFFSRLVREVDPGLYPYDNNGDGQPDSRAEMEQFFTDNPQRDPEFDMNLLRAPATTVGANGYMGPGGEYFRGKPLPDWSGSLGGSLSLASGVTVTTQFDYAFGNFHRQNLSGAFRRSHIFLGRNTRETAQIEATLWDPDATIDEKIDAAMAWTESVGLLPWSGTNAIEKADYLRWRELSLSYRIPPRLIERLGIERMTVTAAGRNLKLWTPYGGIDPESNVFTQRSPDPDDNFVYGIDGWRPGTPARYTFSVRFGF